MTPFIQNIVEIGKIDFAKNCFYEKSIDSFGRHLFAFMRKIKPNDYIMNNTQYKYPKEINEEVEKLIDNYYKAIYSDPDVFIKNVLGDYFIEMNAETFTKAPKGAYATKEFCLAKGRRMVFFNELENDSDNSCNSVDGGAGRRVRIVEWVTKFVEDPDPRNPHQAKLDNEMVSKLCTDAIRDTVLGYIMDKYDVTANTDDKVAAGALLSKFTKESGSKMVAERKEEVKYVPDND
ncbi:hypothetical protein T492DRAFT_851150 [Pavlovales sp. CCMP2436]|nr:hypothetical protein T492DRAFT_851150 [Pavlovales sp. CCMP2436]